MSVSRRYTTTDYQTALAIYLQSRSGDMRAAIDDIVITVAAVARLKLLRLVDGPRYTTTSGERVKLAGLGIKTANEAARLGI